MNELQKLPLKVVPVLKTDIVPPNGGGGPSKIFREVDQAFRGEVASKVIGIRDHFADAFRAFPTVPAVARVRVRKDAVAKSHRPYKLFNDLTCPIIAAEGLDHLLVSVTSAGLERLAIEVESAVSQKAIANLSTLEDLFAFEPLFEVPDDDYAKVKLFRHHLTNRDAAVDQAFLALVENLGLAGTEIHYGPGLKIYKVASRDRHALGRLAGYIGTQSVSAFPTYYTVRTASTAVRNAQPKDMPPPEEGVEYPIVGVIDSGINPDDKLLAPWVVAREVFVVEEERDHSHGTFVGGLIVHGQALNHSDARFPSCSAKILDIVALGTGSTTEYDLITILENVVEKYPAVSVWNLSLSTRDPISEAGFSDFAVKLDTLQDETGACIILAAGNYESNPLRTWPPQDLKGADRICIPSDSVRAIVVGSRAHRDHTNSGVKSGEPSPFSRRGPGPVSLIRPELSHFGGNCTLEGDYTQIGILSLDGNGAIAEDIGTSFATPLTSTLAANVKSGVVGGASNLLTRALLVHAAAKEHGRTDPMLMHYQGFGTPPDVSSILGCSSHECTLIFELEIEPGTAFRKGVFPIPPCLYVDDDTVRAEFLMTVVYEPELDASFGSEYCRTNIDVSLGTIKLVTDATGNVQEQKKGQVPEDFALIGNGLEVDQVRQGFKWSPIKVYRRDKVRGISGEIWRLDLSVHYRADHEPLKKARAVLIITISDPEKAQPVYDEMVVQMNLLGWAASDLQVQERLRP
jgi:serine protease AprX